jgi:hypothetical protein
MTGLLPASDGSLGDMMGLDDRGRKIVNGVLIVGAISLVGGLVYWLYRKGGGSFGRSTIVDPPVNEAGMTLTHYRHRKMPIDERLRILQDLTWKSVQDPRNRKLALGMTHNCPERDGACEAKAVYDHIKNNIRYTGDVAPVKMGADGPIEGVDLFQSAYRTWEFKGGDCLPLSTLVLRDDYTLVPLIALNPGDRIADGEGWTVIQDRWLTGEKKLLAFDLSNGCTFRCSADHRIFRVVGERVEEIRAGEARVGDDLLMGDGVPTQKTPEYHWPSPFDQLSEVEQAWLLGVYVADGWHEVRSGDRKPTPYRVGISGRDGHPKEAQKKRVKDIVEQLGLNTEWHKRFIRIANTDLATFLAAAGAVAPEKRVPAMGGFTESGVQSLLEGLAADATYGGRNHDIRTFGTTSPTLAMQLRVLHRMIGQGVHIRRVDDHGGLGNNPIYRVTVRENPQRRDTKYARIRAIRDGGVELCADLTTETGRLWLPENDLVVHNCDDHSVLAATLLTLNGIPAKFRVTAPSRGGDFSHIYVLAGLPKMRPTKWIPIDTTLPGNDRFGYEVPYGRKADYAA